MSAIRRLPYGQAATIDFHLYATDGTALKVDAAHASGDTTLMKDEGAEANTTNGFTDEGKGYSIALTAAELTAARVVLYVVDQGTQAWLDEVITIETYGHPSAQHPNEGIPLPETGVAQGGAAGSLTLASGAVGTDDRLNGSLLYIAGGTGAGQSRQITDSTASSDVCDVDPNWAITPDNTSVYAVAPMPPAVTGAANAPGVNVKQVNDITVTGAGTAGDPWGP